jgi:undecaprenyl-diphosphatase
MRLFSLSTQALMVVLVGIWLSTSVLGGAASQWDSQILSALRPDELGYLIETARYVNWLGDWLVLIPVGIVGVAFLFWQGKQGEALSLALILISVRLLVVVQKNFLGRTRPDVEQWMLETSFAFPSGHAANSAATYVGLALLLTKSRAAICAATGISAAIGTSRVVLGVHWPSDVIGGWAFGALSAVVLWQLQTRRGDDFTHRSRSGR